MIIAEALHAHLKADTAVAALVGTRIYPILASQKTALPRIVYQRISSPRERSHSGPSGLAHPRFQITSYAGTFPGARTLANAVRASLDGYTGVMGGTGGVRVGSCHLDNERDDYEDGIQAWSVRQDFIIWHKES